MPFTALASISQGLTNAMNELNFQIVGIVVVLLCLGGLAVILSASGSIAAALQNKAKAPSPAGGAANPAAPAKPGSPDGKMTPEMLAVLSAAVDAAMTELTPEMVAVIAAAVDAGLEGAAHRIVDIRPNPASAYAAEGRAEIFASHRIRPSR